MERWFKFSGLWLFFICACSRGGVPLDKSTITISAPTSAHFKAAVPSGRTACYGINITGGGIQSTNGNTCSPPTGLIAGYVQSGQTIQATVQNGTTINVDLYLYLAPLGQKGECPTMTAAFPAAQLPDTYLIGSAPNVVISGPSTEVTITANFPTNNQNITQQLAMPATCVVNSDPNSQMAPNPNTVSAGEKIMTGSAHQLNTRAGMATAAKTLSGTSHKLIVR